MTGSTIAHFEIYEKLGEGGMGVVYKARDTWLDRLVAIKVLRFTEVADPDRKARFLKEAQAASALSHPNIVGIHDFGEINGLSFLVMEFVPGKTLDALIGSKRLRLSQTLSIGAQVAAGIERAHREGIVHRDLKPSNIIIGDDGRARILDFGLAKLREPLINPDNSERTITIASAENHFGAIVGTASYMSPEQADGRRVDHRSDIFSFGCVLYEMITGRRAFSGGSLISTLGAILNQEPQPISEADCPRELRRLIERCLRKHPESRQQNMGDVRLALEELAEDMTTPSAASAPPDAADSQRRIRGSAVAIAALAFLSLWLGYQAYRPGPYEPDSRPLLRRLSWEPGLQMQPTWSPDGKFLAYASNQGGNFDIWIQPVAQGGAISVTRTPEDEFEPDWSPDGQKIVFRRTGSNGGLFVSPALGGAEQRISTFGARPRWSPDGKHVLFEGTSRIVVETARFFTVSLDGESPRPLPSKLAGDERALDAAWHPDGKRISVLLVHFGNGAAIIRTAMIDGSGAVDAPATGFSATHTSARFRWSPRADEILMQTSWGAIARVAVEPRTTKWKSEPHSLTVGDATAEDPAPERNGRRIAFTLRRNAYRIWSVPMDRHGLPLPAKAYPITPPDWSIRMFALAPRVDRIAYRTHFEGNSAVWLQDLKGGTRRTLPFPPGESGLLWSPDGESIAASRYRRGQSGNDEECWVITSLDRSNQRRVLPWSDAYYRFDDWSRDGAWLLGTRNALAHKEGKNAVIELAANADDASDHSKELLSSSDYDFWQPHYSPDQRYIVFNAVKRGDNSSSVLGMIPAGGASQWLRLTDGNFWDDKPLWSPDGKWLYFYSDRSVEYNIWRLPFDPVAGKAAGPPQQVTNYRDAALLLSPYTSGTDWRMGGGNIFLPLLESSGAVWIMDR